MIMDYLRTPYRRECRLFKDSDEVVTLRWYPAPPGAKLFPGWHRFASGDWSVRDLLWPGVGEVGPTPRRRWYKWHGPEKYKGQCFIGPREWYEHGVPHAASLGPILPPPFCCTEIPPELAPEEGSGSYYPEAGLRESEAEPPLFNPTLPPPPPPLPEEEGGGSGSGTGPEEEEEGAAEAGSGSGSGPEEEAQGSGSGQGEGSGSGPAGSGSGSSRHPPPPPPPLLVEEGGGSGSGSGAEGALGDLGPEELAEEAGAYPGPPGSGSGSGPEAEQEEGPAGSGSGSGGSGPLGGGEGIGGTIAEGSGSGSGEGEGSGSGGSGSGGGGGVSSACCPGVGVPTTVWINVSGGMGAGACLNGSRPLTWDSASGQWLYTDDSCGSTTIWDFQCGAFGNVWELTVTGPCGIVVFSGTYTCAPFFVDFGAVSGAGACTGQSYRITATG
jgi:hypothetical protein